MPTTKGWPFLFAAWLLMCGTTGNTGGSDQPKPGRKKVLIVDGVNSLYKKTGDTVWLTGVNEGDTLAFSFNEPPSNGYKWYVDDRRYLDSINFKATPSGSAPGEINRLDYHFKYLVTQKNTFFIRLDYRRASSDVMRKVCIALPLK